MMRTSENIAPRSCAHCAGPLPAARVSQAYCCAGCEAVAGLLAARGLDHYYDLARGRLPAVGAAPATRSHAWLDPLLGAASAPASGELATLDLDVQGIHCAACVWLMNETFRREDGGVAITVNPALGKVRVCWRKGTFDLGAWIGEVERFGYQFGPSRKASSRASSSLTWRLGVCAALAMNVMLFSLSFYFGLSRRDGDIYLLFSRLSLVLSTGVVVVGGWPFFRAAVLGLRRGLLHLDLPIALGIVLVYATSLMQVARGRGGELTYFDTLNTFITLMLLGRLLQERVLERNRQYLLADDGADGIFVRRLAATGLETVRAPQVRRGDTLLVAPGELIPVDAALVDDEARISTDWITGEPRPRAVMAGASLPAGSFNGGAAAITVTAATDFADSSLGTLLRQVAPRDGAGPSLRFWDRLARRWAVGVLVIAATGFGLWLWLAGPGRALDVAVSLLVVTCPCAIGIALPLGYELVQARLRRAGFFARSTDLLDRLERVRRVVFDKTGTLTLGRLELAEPDAVAALPPEARDAAFNLACRSGHPVAMAVAKALGAAGARYDQRVRTAEFMGRGVEGRLADGATWRLGRSDWAFAASGDASLGAPDHRATVLTREGRLVARFETREALRPDARAQLQALTEAGYEAWIVSGDVPARVARLGAVLGLPSHRVLGGCSPEGKAAALDAIGAADAIYVGDGVNDALAFDHALAAGTVAIERPVLPGRSDFFLVGDSLAPLGQALAAARRLRVVVRRVLAISIAYNAFAVTSCLLGVMTPVRAAIFMPASSIGLLLFTAASLARSVGTGSAATLRLPISAGPLPASILRGAA